MILATDVYYEDSTALVAALLFENWTDTEPLHEWTDTSASFDEYTPGEFYKRELPCILPLVRRAQVQLGLSTIVVDGYVDLGGGKPGLGRYLFEELGGQVEIMGVAKSEFLGAPAVKVCRGTSMRPLFVSSTGDLEQAGRWVGVMAGPNRFPDLLRRLDQLSKGIR